MITKEAIENCIEKHLNDNGLFLVDISISKDNDIEITIDKTEGSVKLDDCIALDKTVSGTFNRDEKDYSLTVTSAGLDQPFKVLEQYRKFAGEEVELTLPNGSRIKGVLGICTNETIEITTSRMVKREGEKKKVKEETTTRYGFGEFKYCKPVLKFK